MIHHKKNQELTSNDSGFTIIESLMAIIVVSILMIAIAPAIVLSVATRVQAKRVESAADAARSYIDGVKSGTITPPPVSKTSQIKDVATPTVGSLTCSTTDTNYPYCSVPATNLYCIDNDGGGCTLNSPRDFIVQAFAYNKTVETPENGYQLGLRVYRADGFNSENGALKKAPDKQQSTFTSGLGDRKAPLIEFTTEITAKGTSFSDLCGRLEEKDSSGNNTNPQSKC
jgi:prepilin-type N-terminal cleavage/methylation domain-containing protein